MNYCAQQVRNTVDFLIFRGKVNLMHDSSHTVSGCVSHCKLVIFHSHLVYFPGAYHCFCPSIISSVICYCLYHSAFTRAFPNIFSGASSPRSCQGCSAFPTGAAPLDPANSFSILGRTQVHIHICTYMQHDYMCTALYMTLYPCISVQLPHSLTYVVLFRMIDDRQMMIDDR